jgi:putative addiction module component (TIGR02574 family)
VNALDVLRNVLSDNEQELSVWTVKVGEGTRYVQINRRPEGPARGAAGARAELASFLIYSLDADADRDAERAWDAELQRRGEEIKSGRVKGESAERVFKRLRKKHS